MLNRQITLTVMWFFSVIAYGQDPVPQPSQPMPAEAAPPTGDIALPHTTVTGTPNVPESPVYAVTLQVRERGTGKPLAKAEVKHGDEKIASDAQGYARVQIPAQGEGKLTVSRRGYETFVVFYNEIRPDGEYDVFLLPKTPNDDVVIVRGSRKTQISRKVISAQEARKVAPGGDPAKVIQLLPGVQSRAFGSRVIIRGSASNNSRYFVDDLEVPFIFHSIGDISVLPVPLIQDVEFDSGGFGVDKGDAMGGIITLRTKSDVPERPFSEILVNVPFYSGVYHERPFSESDWIAVSYRRSYIDLIIGKILESRSDETGGLTVLPYFGDAHVFYTRKDDAGQTKISLIGAYDGIKLAASADAAQDETGTVQLSLDTRFVNLGVERQTRLNQDWRYVSTPQAYYFVIRNDFAGNLVNLDVLNLRSPTEFTRRLSPKEDLNVGVDPGWGVAKISLDSIQPRFDDPSFDIEDAEKETLSLSVPFYNMAAWASIDHMFGDLKLTPGARGFYNSQIRKTSMDPRLKAKYALTETQTLKAAVGQYSEAPEPQQATPDFGNPNLGFQHSYHYVLGIESNWDDMWTTDFQGFVKQSNDIVASSATEKYANSGSLKSYGFEAFLRRNLTGRAFGWLSYTYSKTVDRRNEEDDYAPSQYDQTHVLNLVGNYRLTAIWDLGARYAFHTGDTYTPVADAYYNANLDKYQPKYRDADRNTARMPLSHSLSLYSSYDFLYDTWKLIAKLGVESYWVKKQPFAISYNYDYSKEQYIYSLGAIPFVELRGEF